MYLIAGLGNPTKEYEKTRHNMGFDCLDILADKLGVKFKESKFGAMVAKGMYKGEQVLLVKPLTYMNLSGNAIAPLAKYYKVDTKNALLVVYDDTDLDIGKIRIRKKGSAGGHNGMKSIIANLGHEEFGRIRVGIGKRPGYMEMVDFVLGRFSAADRKLVDESLEKGAEAALEAVASGLDKAMNMYNG